MPTQPLFPFSPSILSNTVPPYKQRANPIQLPPIVPVQRGEPLTMDQWKRHLDPSGRVTCVGNLRQIIFQGFTVPTGFTFQGVEPSLRPIVWKYLLGYYLWDNTAAENEKRRIDKHREYHKLKQFWKEMSVERLDRFSLFRERKCFIEKDVPRTDRKCSFFRDDSNRNLTRLYDILLTYTVYNMDCGKHFEVPALFVLFYSPTLLFDTVLYFIFYGVVREGRGVNQRICQLFCDLFTLEQSTTYPDFLAFATMNYAQFVSLFWLLFSDCPFR
ncbi:unnamed protein product [Echinostoma caproni]|uniref:Rab-GAP TBC domain-containing protein n=1 Tax=Echinostoma caproni TaxID=27848 RepID=A0A183AWT7_9TREM|nr:unnamed protein product [Echinostoma caproni]